MCDVQCGDFKVIPIADKAVSSLQKQVVPVLQNKQFLQMMSQTQNSPRSDHLFLDSLHL